MIEQANGRGGDMTAAGLLTSADNRHFALPAAAWTAATDPT